MLTISECYHNSTYTCLGPFSDFLMHHKCIQNLYDESIYFISLNASSISLDLNTEPVVPIWLVIGTVKDYYLFKNCSICFVILGIDIGFGTKRNLLGYFL